MAYNEQSPWSAVILQLFCHVFQSQQSYLDSVFQRVYSAEIEVLRPLLSKTRFWGACHTQASREISYNSS